ncbi:MAG: uracil phosphoribosyltransferase [Armatimonadota bacterium]|nr:uracil phosphoribosyltransferase [Armatimonadota bacterium]MDR7443927.1 uracil phosphoribosyltransferase [Armatimonadota bacterium]MDR7570415.1 uracil phosphoribosyltransferase [Armatimonadota bacterium]MDR7613214.1 uracil phosphoribosyltransferase [Armatimonadota bacterium]
MSSVRVVDHPLIQHKLSLLRDRRTPPKEFRELVEEISMLLAFEATRDLHTREVEVETPLMRTRGRSIAGSGLAVVSILRAGLGMEPGIVKLLPTARVGHVGIERDPETLLPGVYYVKLPEDMAQREALILDPMLATGGSASACVHLLKEQGARRFKFLCLIAAPEGIARLHTDHPEVEIYAAAVDEGLDAHGYILPGLGDAGDRLFGTR